MSSENRRNSFGSSPRKSFTSRYLDPSDSLSEVLSGIIMTLTFTLGAGLIVKEGEASTTKFLLGILGCNIAWGIVDGAMYVINSLLERSRNARLLESVQKTAVQLKDLIESKDLLEVWYDFEQKATAEALRNWCRENDVSLND